MAQPSAADRLRQRLRTSLREALKARDSIAAAALRSALSAIDNAEAVGPADIRNPLEGKVAGARLGVGVGDVDRKQLSSDDLGEILRREIAERIAAADQFAGLGRLDETQRLRAEAEVLQAYLDGG